MTESPGWDADLDATMWDVAVIGAGPAGSVAARESARQGLRTLLIEARVFPRSKVCGGCLNPRALHVLATMGLQTVVDGLEGDPIGGMSLRSGGRTASLTLPTGLSVTRRRLDAALLEAASRAAVRVVMETTATVAPEITEGCRRISLRHPDRTIPIRARMVVCADGLLRSSIRGLPHMDPGVVTGARMGVGIVLSGNQLPAAVAGQFPHGQITMLVGRGGYVGVAWAERDQLSLAAAVDPEVVKAGGSPALAVHEILSAHGIDFPMVESGWHGTPPLTTTPRCNAAERLFVIGDAAGYVEPFTGEGMAAALEEAQAVVPLIVRGVRDWRPEWAADWQRQHRTRFRRRQRTCRMASAILRRPWLSNTALTLLRTFPDLAAHFINRVSRPATFPAS